MYKSISFILLAIIFLISCKNTSQKDDSFAKAVISDLSEEIAIPTKDGVVDTSKMAILTFEEPTFDFGKINEGEIIKHTFKFKNTGSKDLFLLYHKATCGCTVPSFSKEAYPPGATGTLTVEFDTKGKKLSQNKKIKIYSNTFPNMTSLTMKGFVKPKK